MFLISMPQVQLFEETHWAEPDLLLMADPDFITSTHIGTCSTSGTEHRTNS
jgi:hypothetical protein